MKKLLYILSVLILLSSCTGKKRVTKGKNELDTRNEAVLAIEKNRYEEALQTAFDFKSLQSRAKYSFGKKSLNGRLNIERGKRLCMTVTVLGIEVARVEVNRETVLIVDKFDKIYTELSIEEFADRMGLQDEMRYEAIECLLLGRMFIPGCGEAEAKDFKKLNWTIKEENLVGELSKPRYSLEYVIGNDNKLANTIVKANGGAEEVAVAFTYRGHQSIEGGEFATQEQITLFRGNEEIKAELTLSAPIMGKTWTPFSPTEAYKQVSMQELVTAIKNMKN